jgi:cyclophilin family peptidyl-prolyl cis-trans isomerase
MAWLAGQGRLDDLSWHRVVPGFVVQTGCPRGDGMGGTPWMIPDEVSMEMFEAGSVGMARSARDTGGSQWFVTASRQPHLAGDYTRFGEVADGLDVVRRLGQADRVLRVRVVPPARRDEGGR